MGLKLPDLPPDFFLPDTAALVEWATNSIFEIEFEQGDKQLLLKSDIAHERAIGIKVDETLARHLEYFKKSSLYKENLARALGIKPGVRPRVLDLTAGLLGDSLMMLAMGCEVTSLERHPVVSFLIESALHGACHPLLKNHTFHATHALAFLGDCAPFDVVYFDPMFEDANHKAGAKKEMRIFREMVGNDADAVEVFHAAQKKARKRVVVKRPRYSQGIESGQCLQYLGKATRYDTYLQVK